MNTVSKYFIAKGHLVDSGILTHILNLIVEEGADYQITKFDIGKTNLDFSSLELLVQCSSKGALEKAYFPAYSFRMF